MMMLPHRCTHQRYPAKYAATSTTMSVATFEKTQTLPLALSLETTELGTVWPVTKLRLDASGWGLSMGTP